MRETKDLRKFYYCSFPTEAVLVTVKDKDKTNAITIAWHCTISKNPPLYGISVAPGRYSHDLIDKSKEFVINFMPFSLVEKIHFCGTKTGKNIDKIKELDLKLESAKKISTKAIKESYAYFECKLFDKINLGDHTFFVGKVLNSVIDEKSFNKGILDINRTKPCYYLGDKFYTDLSGEGKEF